MNAEVGVVGITNLRWAGGVFDRREEIRLLGLRDRTSIWLDGDDVRIGMSDELDVGKLA